MFINLQCCLAGFFSLFIFTGCGESDKPEVVDQKKDSNTPAKAQSRIDFSYKTKFTPQQREKIKTTLENTIAEDKQDLSKLVSAMASLKAIDEYIPLNQKNEKTIEKSIETSRKYDEAKQAFILKITQSQTLLDIVEINDKSLTNCKRLIRDAYKTKYASQYDTQYVNELMTPHIEVPATMMQYRISDDVVEGIQARYSFEHNYDSSIKAMKELANTIADDIALKILPKK